jgi:hypothetical protein
LFKSSSSLSGIFFVNGEIQWRDQRRFSLWHLRDFGFGRRFQELEVETRDEIADFIQMVKEGPKFDHENEFLGKNGRVQLPHALIATMGNCFLQVFIGKRFPRAEQGKLIEAGKGGFGFLMNTNEYGNVLSILPWIRHFAPDASKFNVMRRSSMILYNFVKEIIDKELESYQEGEVRHFIDLYAKEMRENHKNENSAFFCRQIPLIFREELV